MRTAGPLILPLLMTLPSLAVQANKIAQPNERGSAPVLDFGACSRASQGGLFGASYRMEILDNEVCQLKVVVKAQLGPRAVLMQTVCTVPRKVGKVRAKIRARPMAPRIDIGEAGRLCGKGANGISLDAARIPSAGWLFVGTDPGKLNLRPPRSSWTAVPGKRVRIPVKLNAGGKRKTYELRLVGNQHEWCTLPRGRSRVKAVPGEIVEVALSCMVPGGAGSQNVPITVQLWTPRTPKSQEWLHSELPVNIAVRPDD